MRKKKVAAPRTRRKNIEALTREEIIAELAKHLSPEAFRKNLTESTAMLRGLLCYNRDPLKDDERIFPAVGSKHIPVKCGCGAPWAHTGKHWPNLPGRNIGTIGGMPVQMIEITIERKPRGFFDRVFHSRRP